MIIYRWELELCKKIKVSGCGIKMIMNYFIAINFMQEEQKEA